jgi:hypothetical protein
VSSPLIGSVLLACQLIQARKEVASSVARAVLGEEPLIKNIQNAQITIAVFSNPIMAKPRIDKPPGLM